MIRSYGDFEWVFNLEGFEYEPILSALNPELHVFAPPSHRYSSPKGNAKRAVNRQPGDRAGTRRADTPEHQEKSIKTIKLVGIKELKLTQKSIQRCFFDDIHPEPSQI